MGWVGALVPVIITICLLLQKLLNNKLWKIDKKRRVDAENRTNTLNEIIAGAKSVKLNAWENVMKEKLREMRQREKNKIISMFTLRGVAQSIVSSIPAFCGVVCFSLHGIVYDEKLTVSQTYSLLILFNLFLAPLQQIIQGFSSYMNAQLSVSRMNNIVQVERYEGNENDKDMQKGEIQIINGYFSWENKKYRDIFEGKKAEKKPKTKQNKTEEKQVIENTYFLQDINIKFNPGEFSAIIGKVGSGKTSLILALMNEIGKEKGDLKKNGNYGYIGQEAFLINETLRNNILFGEEYNKEKYEEILDICQLRPDIEMLPGGDQTEIGSKGINLSGGQKQRVNIARAVYADRDIYLIDDCLSALDAYVGKAILQDVFKGKLRNKTRIMVTHHLHHLHDMEKVILIDQGKIVAQGKYDEIKKTKAYNDFAINDKEIVKSEEEVSLEEIKDEKSEKLEIPDEVSESDEKRMEYFKKNNPKKEEQINEEIKVTKVNDKEIDEEEEKKDKGKLTKKERRFIGRIRKDVFLYYFIRGGVCMIISIILFFLIATTLKIGADWWVGQWSANKFDLKSQTYIWIYGLIILVYLLFIILKAYIFGHFAARASIKLFNDVIWNILRKPLSFFDTTPVGVVLNICSQDIEVCDFQIPFQFSSFFDGLFGLLGTLLLASFVAPITVIIILLSIFLFISSLKKYMRTGTEIRRLFENAISPYISTNNEINSGQTDIRAFGKREYMLVNVRKHCDDILTAFIHEQYTNIWINLRMKFSVSLVVLVAGFFIIFSKTTK